MKPFKSTTMLRPLNDAELQLEDPQWEDDETVTFYIPCWFNVDLFFSGLHVVTDENDDYINLYCAYNTKTHSGSPAGQGFCLAEAGAEIKNRLEHGQGAIPPMLHWCKATY